MSGQSPSPEEARAALVEAGTHDAMAWMNALDSQEMTTEQFVRGMVTAALTAALAARTEPEPCETCGGHGWTEHLENLALCPTAAEHMTGPTCCPGHECESCHGSGSGSRSLYLLDVIRGG